MAKSKYSKFVAASASAALVATAVAPVASLAASFKDVPSSSDYYSAVTELSNKGIINGYEDGTFKIRNKVTRAEAAKMIAVARGFKSDAATPFKDVVKGSWYEEHVNALYAEGLLEGRPGGVFEPQGNLSRAEFAKLVVEAYDLPIVKDAKLPFTDMKNSLGQDNWATDYISTLYTYGFINGKTPTTFAPTAEIDRGDMALLLNRVENGYKDIDFGAVAGVKAINATTVEVTYKEAVKDVNSVNYSIDGLTISNAAVKQTDNKTVVLTTSTQTGGTKYTVKQNGQTIGQFEGISAVIPTKITTETASLQGVVGKEVTLKANIGVKQAGVPVTFNVKSDAKLNDDHVEEVYTNEDGVATYSYTQYNAGVDTVSVYPTGAPAVRDVATIHWGVDAILAIAADDKKGDNVNNGENKVYKVTYKDPNTGKPVANQRLHVTFAENVNTSIDKTSKATVNGVNPVQLTNGTAPVTAVITTDSKGEATFTISGTNTKVTPVVFADEVVNNKSVNTWDATKLQAKAAEVTFAATQAEYTIDVTRDGGQEAAVGVKNGREYKVVVKKKDGSVAANEIVNVAFNEDLDRNINTNTKAYFVKDDAKVGESTTVKTNSKGEATFKIGSDDEKDYATPIAWIDINTSNAKEGKLDEGEPFTIADITYFAKEALTGGTVKAYLGTKEQKDFKGTETATFKFTASNQSGKEMSLPAGYDRIEATFTVFNTGAHDVLVDGQVVSPNRSYTTTKKIAATPTVDVTTVGDQTTSVRVVATGTALPTNTTGNTERPINLGSHEATAAFTSTQEVTGVVKANVEWVNVKENTMKLSGYRDTIDYSKAKFFVADRILNSTPNTAVPAQAGQTYTETTLADFNRFIYSNSTITFTKGTDGAHTIRLEAVAGNGTNEGPVAVDPVRVPANVVTPGVSTAAPAVAAKYESAVISTANFSTGSFDVTVATASTATVTINGTDTAAQVADKINAALAANNAPATASAANDRVQIVATNATSADTIKIANSTIPGVFANATVAYTPAKVVTAGVANYTFSADIAPGEKVEVNGVTYTAGTANSGLTFDASGSLATDLSNLALAINFKDTSVSASSASPTVTLTERAGKEGTVTFGPILIK